MQDRQDHRYAGHKFHGRKFDKQNANGVAGENFGKRDGHGRGGWGNTHYEGDKAEKQNTEGAIATVEAINTAAEEVNREEEKVEEPAEEEVNNKTFAELKAERANGENFRK